MRYLAAEGTAETAVKGYMGVLFLFLCVCVFLKQTPKHCVKFLNPEELGEGRVPGLQLSSTEVFAVQGVGGRNMRERM